VCAPGACQAWSSGPSTYPLGAMSMLFHKFFAGVAASALAVTLWSTSTPAQSATPTPLSICTLAAHPDAYDGKVVSVRTAIEYGVEYTRLFDTDCPDTSVFAKPESGVDILCPADLSEKYGCPINFGTGVRVNLKGAFHRYKGKNGGIGTLDVSSLSVAKREHGA
jgi:hypothetical protein